MAKQGEDQVTPKFEDTKEFSVPTFDSTTEFKDPSLKKKEQTLVKSSPSTSELVGSTSELEGSVLGSQKDSTPTINLSDSELGIQPEIPTLKQSDIDAIDFQSIGEQTDRPSFAIPEIPSFKDIKTSARKSDKIQNIIRRSVVSNPEMLNSPGFDDAVFDKVRSVTRDDDLAKETVESLKILRRESDILSTESQESLDVTPDFNSPQILSQLSKANAELSKQELIRFGSSEEDADIQSKILFPENEISKSIELGINIDKVKNDYRSFLEKVNPEKLSDINAAAKVGNFSGQFAMDFMKEALSHQADVLDAKINTILSVGSDNLTEEDINNLESIESQRERLGERFKNVIVDFPELQEKAVKEKVSQQRVDDSYKEAKANVLLPGFDGDKAKAEVLYHQVISPVLGASVNMVGDLAKFGINQVRGISDDEITKGAAGIMSDWANGFFDTEKSSSIYKKPSALKGSLFENGDIKAEKLIPKVSETLFQMYAMLGGGGATGTALEGIGLGANISQKLGLITSSYVLTQNDYFEEAKSLGMSDNEANNFGNAASLLTSGLELINPQTHIFGKEGKRAFTKSVINAINSGVDMKTAIKQNSKFIAKEIIGENAQEFAQEAGDLGIKYLFNKKNGNENFDVNVTQDELKELVLLTSIVSGGGSVHGVKSRSGLEKSSLFSAAKDIDKFKKFLENPESEKNFTPQQLKDVSEKVTEYKEVVDGLPDNLDEDSEIELAHLVFQKRKLSDSKSKVFTDDIVASKSTDNIDTQINEINGQIEIVFDDQKETNIDKPIKSFKLKTEDKGDVEYKVGDKFLSEKEVIEQVNDENFIKAVKDGETELSISNPSPEVSQALENSGILTNKQLQTIKIEPDAESKETKDLEAKTESKEAVLETPKATEPVVKEGSAIVKEGEKSTAKDVITETVIEIKEETPIVKEGETKLKTEQETLDRVKNTRDRLLRKSEGPGGLRAVDKKILKQAEKFIEKSEKPAVEEKEDAIIEEKKTKAKVKISNALEKLKKSTGKTLSTGGLNPESIEAVGELISGYAQLGALNTQQIVRKVISDLKAVGIEATEEDIKNITEGVSDFSDLKSKEDSETKGPEKDQKKEEKIEVKPESKEKLDDKRATKGPEEKQSGFQKRTLSEAEGTPAKEQVSRVVEENKQFYTVMNVSDTVKQASKNIEKEGGFDSAYERLITEKVDIDALAVLQVERQLALDFYGEQLDSAVKEGRKADTNKAYKRANALQESISKDATRAGQANAMLQMWKALRPDGTVEFMNRKIKAHNETMRNKKPRGQKETIGNTIDNFQDFIQDLTNDQISEILDSPKGKSIIDKIVSKNKGSIKNELNAKLKRRKAKVDSVVSRLDSLKIKGDKLFALPPGVNLLPTVWNGSIEIIKKSIQAGETMASAIEKAVVFIKSKVGEEDFGESSYRSQFAEEKKSLDSDSEISSEIDKALEDIGINIKDVISKHYSEKDALGRTLSEKLIEDSGMSISDAKNISELIQEEFKKKIKDQAEKRLSKDLGISRIPVKKEVKILANDLIEKINLGALDSDFYNGLFAEKFKLAKPLTPEQRVELKRLADVVGKQDPGSIFERKAVMEMLKFMDSTYPRNNALNTFFSLYYASLLSGMSTSVLNIVSAGSNIIMKPIRDMTNLSKWVMAGRKGFENKSFKDFLAYAPFNDTFYMPAAFTHAASLGNKEFSETWTNGDLDSKFIEQVANKEFSKLNPLERDRYGKNAFKPINIKVAGKKISINPFNYYKFSGRNLAAQDKLMFRVSSDIELVSIIREKMLDEGLRGAELRKATIDEYTQRHTDMDAVNEQLDKEFESFEKDTGEKMTKSQRSIRKREILEKNIDPEIRQTAEDMGRSSIFTDERGGMIANMASFLGKLSNQNPALSIALKPWIPFTRVVGNVSEYMMDTIPIYGQMRANGLSVTSLAKWGTKSNINTSQMGVPGSREYYEQMGRAWLGTSAFLVLGSLLIGTDEEDDFYITGGFSPDKFKRGRENVTPKYTVVIKGFEIPYLNIPGLAIPLSMIGNYNDRINFGDKSENLTDRITASAFNSIGTIRDMSFVKGVQDLTKMITDVMSGEESGSKRVGRELYKKYFLTVTKPLPQNFNLVDQIEKIFDPTSFSQRDIEDITMYGLGIQRFVNNPSLDLFGEELKTLPGTSLLPYDHWIGLKGEDDRWKFLSKYNSIQNKVSGNQDIYFYDEEGNEERRKPEKEELFEYSKLAGKNFDVALREYMSEGGFEDREKDEVLVGQKVITGIQDDIKNLWSDAKFDARDELFSQ